jgi:hypothetical protein
MGVHWDDQVDRYVSDCESLADHAGIPIPHAHQLSHVYSSRELVLMAVWTGNVKVLHRWPSNTNDGIAEAKAWCEQYDAEWSHGYSKVRPGDLDGFMSF